MLPSIAALPALRDNYIWAFALPAGGAVVVDPGEAAPVDAWLARTGLALRTILVTHHHPDHIGGVPALVARHDSVDVIAPHDPRIPVATRRVDDGDHVDDVLDALPARVVAVPGHTRSHIAYAIGDAVLFCGDTLFGAGCGRLFEGTPAQMHASLARFDALPDAMRVCCGHEYTAANCRFALTVEPDNADLHARIAQVDARRSRGEPSLPSTLGEERATNPFLRVDAAAVRAFARAAGVDDIDDRVAVFAAVRAAKDRFA